MIISPEFHRQMWRFNPWTLCLTLAVMGLVFYGPLSVIWAVEKPGMMVAALTVVSLNLFGFIAIIMTSGCAGSSFSEDVKDMTWDFQRMSSISPWDLAIGRYMGATVSWWIAAVAVMAVALGLYAVTIMQGNIYLEVDVLARVVIALLTAVALGLTAYLIAMAEVSASGPDIARSGSGGVGILPVLVYGAMALEMNSGSLSGISFIMMPEAGSVEWWGHAFDAYAFWACSLVFLIYWMLAAVYRLAKAELQFRCSAVVWVMFNICLALYAAGFGSGIGAGLAGTVTLMALAILGMAMMPSPGFEGRMMAAWRDRAWRRFFVSMPGGVYSVMLATAAYIVFMGYALLTGQAERVWGGYSMAALAGTGFLYVLRDSLFLNAVRKGVLEKKATEFAVMTYFIGLHAVLPVVLIVIGERDAGKIEGVGPTLSVFIHGIMVWPLPHLLMQTVAAGLLFGYAIRRHRKRAV